MGIQLSLQSIIIASSSGGIAMAKLVRSPLSRALNSVAQVLFSLYMCSCVPQSSQYLIGLEVHWRSVGE